MLILLAAALAPVPAAADLGDMVALYDEVCLQTFPIDGQVDALMAGKGATPLTSDQVRVTLRDDPGRGWYVTQGGRTYTVFLELPPFHACSVRANVGSTPYDLGRYRVVADAFASAHPGFKAQPPMDGDQGAIQMHGETEYRDLPGGGSESLMVIDQHITDPARRAKGETGVVLRFVHQIMTRG
jgi:hypothetical protein